MTQVDVPRRAAPVEWRAQSSTLWLARRDGDHLGMVEQRGRYRTVDRFGAVRGTFATLDDAKRALVHPTTTHALGRTASSMRSRVVSIGLWLTGAAGAVAALLGLLHSL